MSNTHGGPHRNQGRKRTATLPGDGELKRLHIKCSEETLTFLKKQDNLSEYVRQAIQEKREKETTQ